MGAEKMCYYAAKTHWVSTQVILEFSIIITLKMEDNGQMF